MSIAGGAKRLAVSAAMTTLAVGALGAGAAHASTVSKSGATLSYNAAAGETNHLVVSLAGGAYTMDDTGATIGAGAGCTPVSATKATCPSAGITSVAIDAGNMNDLAWVTAATNTTINGAAGNDTLIGNNGNDILIGCEGDDTMIAGAGADLLFDNFFNCPGGGNDSLDPGTGPDSVNGGPGTDTVTYSGRTAPVYVSLDGGANDGEAGESDQVSTDVENVTGGSGDDSITGGPGPNTIRGGAGNDVLVGERNPTGAGGGNDSIFGEAGGDAIAGGDGDNLLVAGDGNDTIQGGTGADSFDGGLGDDDMEALDGVIDAVNCGSGADFGVADVDDVISPSCEALDRSSFPPDEFPPEDGFSGDGFTSECSPDQPTLGASGLPPDEGVSAQGGSGQGGSDLGFSPCADVGEICSSLRISHRPASLQAGEVGVRLSLPKDAGGTCKGRVKLSLPGATRKADPGKLKLGSEAFSLRPGQSKRFEVQINSSGRRLLRSARHLRVRVGVFARQDGESFKVAGAVIVVEAPDHTPHRP